MTPGEVDWNELVGCTCSLSLSLSLTLLLSLSLSLTFSPTDGVLVAVCLYGVVIFHFRSNFQPTEEELKWVQERFKGDFVVSTLSYVQYSNAGLIHVLLPYALCMCYTATHNYMITQHVLQPFIPI